MNGLLKSIYQKESLVRMKNYEDFDLTILFSITIFFKF